MKSKLFRCVAAWGAMFVGLAAGTRPAQAEPPEPFPIGMYGLTLSCTNDFPALRDAGFNCIQSYSGYEPLDVFLAACKSHDLKLLITPGTLAGPAFNPDSMRKFMERAGADAPILAWYMMDEPDFQKVPPADVARCRDAIKASGTKFPAATVIGDGKAAGFYAATTDILMVDWYPIPHLPLASFGTAVRQSRFAAGPEKPVWGVVQVFDWGTLFPRASRLDASRFPSEQEMRAMSLLGVVEGASGLFFFVHQHGLALKPITQRKEEWKRLTSVTKELSRQSPVLAAPTIWSPTKSRIEKNRLRWRNPIGDEALQVARKRLKEDSGDFAAGDYLLVVNTTSEERASEIWVPGLRGNEVKIDGRDDPATITGGWIEDIFEPYATRIYGPLPLKEEAAGH